jgi:hypothetical protein
MMKTLKIRNWERFQQYKDREPKWIKLYRSLNHDYEWCNLSDKARAQLIGLWLLRAEIGKDIPFDDKWIMSQISGTGQLLIEELVTAGFIEVYDSVQDCTQSVYVETETETEKNIDQIPFDPWYDSYPKKKEKAAAKKEWEKLDNEERQKAIDALPLQIKEWAREGRKKQFMPSPRRWLHNECWNDDFSTESQSQLDEGIASCASRFGFMYEDVERFVKAHQRDPVSKQEMNDFLEVPF